MIKAVLVGDEPSTTNVHKDLAFVGAKCFPTVIEWIKHMSLDYYVCLNSHTPENLDKIYTLTQQGFKVIAFGRKASKRLEKLKIEHFVMPHPSPRNRKLNDKQKIALDLLSCQSYLWDLYK